MTWNFEFVRNLRHEQEREKRGENMSKLLFEDALAKGPGRHDRFRVAQIIVGLSAGVFLILGLICLLLREHIASWLTSWAVALIMGYLCVRSGSQRLQYLRIYEDRICYKRMFEKSRELHLLPTQYRIKLRYAPPRSGYSITLVFEDLQGKKLLTYHTVSLWPSRFQGEKQPWEIKLFAIGCTVIDDQEVIKNL